MSIKVYGAKPYREELKGIVRDMRVLWALEEVGLKFEHIDMDITKGENKTEAYLKLNPMGKVPTLTDGDFAIYESGAICEYIATKYGKLLPTPNTPDYFIAKQWCYFTLTNLEPQAVRILAADYFWEPGTTTDEIKKMALEIVPRFLSVLNQRLENQSYLMSEFSIADIFAVTTLMYMGHTPILTDYPALQKYMERCQARPAFAKARAVHG